MQSVLKSAKAGSPERDPDCHQKFNRCSFYHNRPLHKKNSSQSIHNFLSNVANKQTDKQANTIPKT